MESPATTKCFVGGLEAPFLFELQVRVHLFLASASAPGFYQLNKDFWARNYSFTPKLTADSLAYNDFRTDPSLASDLRDETLTGNSAADFQTKETGLSLGAPLLNYIFSLYR